ncbi:hypothetical protein ACFTSF_05750 [Kribbella sp. NPDC056951]|uniref:hypothetical protein n=1 Tax=Kribbella sp. NPDC056951 TaxID=3345978 RepID=UPI00363E082D
MDASEQRIADSLTRHAADAPSDHDLLATVHTRLRRRRTGRVVGAAVLVVVAIAAGLSVTQSLRTEPPPAPQPLPAPVQVGPAAPGWRWESYKTAQVQVPVAWEDYITGPAPCRFMRTGVPLIGRFSEWLPRDHYTCDFPVYPLKSRQPYVWFDDAQEPGIKQYDGGWSEETRVVGGTKVTVLAPNEAQRRRIIDTARPIGATDAYGCTPIDSGTPTEMRTEPATGAEICEYVSGSLIASSRVPGRLAAQLGKALLKDLAKPSAPPAEGCQNRDPRTYVVKLHSGARSWTMRLVYDNCAPGYPDSTNILRTGPHDDYDPSSLHDPPFKIVPPQR